MTDIYDVAVLSVLLGVIGLCIAGLLLKAWLVAYRWYRGNTPRRMATRVRGLPRPSKDATRYMTPGSL